MNRRLFWEIAFIVFAATLAVRIVIWQSDRIDAQMEWERAYWMVLKEEQPK